MNKITKWSTFSTVILTPSLANAHVGAIARETNQHAASHLIEIAIFLSFTYLGFRLWRGFVGLK